MNKSKTLLVALAATVSVLTGFAQQTLEPNQKAKSPDRPVDELVIKPSSTPKPGESSRISCNLGTTPWKFQKDISQNQVDLALNKPLQISDANNAKTIVVDLDTMATLESATVTFKNTNISHLQYTIEGSVDGQNWKMLLDHNIPGLFAYVQFLKTNEVAKKEKNDGYIFLDKTIGSYFTSALTGESRYVKVTLLDVKGNEQEPVELLPDIALAVSGSKTSREKKPDYTSPDYNDENWEQVGIPHCYNDMDTYLNATDMHTWKGVAWYRKQFKVDERLKGKKIFLEFKGVELGVAVYVNGKLKPGNTAVPQKEGVTHVGGFLPFVLDITDDINYGASNQIAVKVSNARNSFFTWPGFGDLDILAMGWGGIVCPVYLHVTDKLHVPFNAYSPMNKWGNYIATVKATPERARIRIQTNVENENPFDRKVTVINNLVDANNKTVLSLKSEQTVAAGKTVMFDQSGDILNPHLWYPNNSPYGKPYLYKVVTTVEAEGKVIDREETKTGLRTITWDDDYCYVNGKKHLLNGFGYRHTYPALGSATPEAVEWNDIKLIADAGGNALRVGHGPASESMISACDAYGILMLLNSGDTECYLKNEPANTYKREYDRDMVIAYRNNPSIAVWESNNGLAHDGDKYLPIYTQQIAEQWDSLQPRIVANRDSYPERWPANKRIMVGYTSWYQKVEGSPSLNMEDYGVDRSTDPITMMMMARDDYANEKRYSDYYVRSYNSDIRNKACGWIDWMLAETTGEGLDTYLNGRSLQKSLGSCAMDGNRFPKLKYNIYKNALWVDYATKPGVALQSTWNLSGIQNVDAWSNCPQVALYLNGKNLGTRQPDPQTKRCTWESIAWESGTLKAVGLDAKGKEVCSDTRITAGAPHHIELTIEPQPTKPDGTQFRLTANGTDAAIITARVVDKDGNLCVDAGNNIDFEVSGEGNYRGSYNFYITEGKPLNYHAPGDKQLQAEGGLMRIAIRSTFTPGTVKVTASSKGLGAGEVSYKTFPTKE